MQVPYTDFPEQYRQEKPDLLRAIDEVLSRGDFVLGKAVEDFEQQFSALCGVPFAVGVASGTDALTLSLKCLGIGPGDEVITVPNSWVSTASCIALVGARPVFVDVADDLNIDPTRIEAALTPRTRAIIPVHLTGRPAPMDEIHAALAGRQVALIEDAAQAVGARYRQRSVGALGQLGCFSLHPLKNLNACGDAGIVTCSDAELAGRLRMLRNHGLEDREHVQLWGYCSRLDSLQAAILSVRMAHLARIEARRRETAAFYNEHLRPYVVTPEPTPEAHHVYHTYVIQTERRDELAAFLRERQISVKVHYPVPLHLQEAAAYLGYRAGDFPNTERLCQQILTLPVHQYLSDNQKHYVVATIKEFFEARPQ